MKKMKTIETSNKIFKSEEYQKDKYLFTVFEKKINDNNARIVSDEKNYVITNESENTGPWIWTKDNFDKSKLKEIEEVIRSYLVKDKMTFTSKRELYNALLQDNFDYMSDYFELWFMRCEKLKDTKPNDGRLDRASLEEKDLIADYIYEFTVFQDDSVTHSRWKTEEDLKNECLKEAEKEINSGDFYVLRNRNNKIVCMGHCHFREYGGTATIWLVYTPEEERGKWYAAKLVHELTQIILDRLCVPVLYTDQNYPNSNKAYANAWYENRGTLINFSVTKTDQH